MDSYDYNHKKSNNLPIGRLKKLEENIAIYGPLNEFGFPEKVDATSANYYTKILKIRMKAIENICSYIKTNEKECDLDALRKERTKVLQKVSSIIEEAKKKAEESNKPLSLKDEKEAIVMAYAIKKKEENCYLDSFEEEESYSDEEFYSAEELFVAYGGEGPISLSKRFGTNINIIK